MSYNYLSKQRLLYSSAAPSTVAVTIVVQLPIKTKALVPVRAERHGDINDVQLPIKTKALVHYYPKKKNLN